MRSTLQKKEKKKCDASAGSRTQRQTLEESNVTDTPLTRISRKQAKFDLIYEKDIFSSLTVQGLNLNVQGNATYLAV